MRFLFIIIIPLLIALAPGDSFAAKKVHNKSGIFYGENNSPIDYTRTNILIIRKSLPKTPKPISLPDKDNIQPIKAPEPEPVPVPDPGIILDVEVRDAMSLYNQNGWFNLSSYSDKSGIMMAFGKPDIKPIIRSNQYAPVDILFIDKQGKIIQIVPNILLSELEEEIYPNSPILAFLFLKGGACADLLINAGDEVQYSLFKKPPVILSAPTNPNAPKPLETIIKDTPEKRIPTQQIPAPVQPVILK
jgi:uncharacterized membrane protein (UPF0127 family)